MTSHSRGAERPAVPQNLVVVKPFGENIDDTRHERRMAAQCFRMGAALAVITNGRRWLLLFQAPGFQESGHRFREVDVAVGPMAAARYLNRYLSRDSIASGWAGRSAERTLLDRTGEAVSQQAVLDGWRRMVLGLLDLVATAAEQRTGYRPETRLVRRVVLDSRAELCLWLRTKGGW